MGASERRASGTQKALYARKAGRGDRDDPTLFARDIPKGVQRIWSLCCAANAVNYSQLVKPARETFRNSGWRGHVDAAKARRQAQDPVVSPGKRQQAPARTRVGSYVRSRAMRFLPMAAE